MSLAIGTMGREERLGDTFSCFSLCPESFNIASSIAFVWNAMLSRIARQIWFLVVYPVIPTIPDQHHSI